MEGKKFFNRELSWLSFNYRVLQEAKNESVPLYERLKFLAIYSSNLDEFYRVRVASIRALLNLKNKSLNSLKFNPKQLLKEIKTVVSLQQEEFGEIFTNSIKPELTRKNTPLLNIEQLNDAQLEFVESYYSSKVIQYIQPIVVVKNKIVPFLQNRRLYFAVRLKNKLNKNKEKYVRYTYAIIEIPTHIISRFVKVPLNNGYGVLFVDDIIRHKLSDIFSAYQLVDAYEIKLTRDADLYIDDEFSGNLLKKIKKGLSKRNLGLPARFLYDEAMPKPFLKFLKESLLLKKEDLVPGGRYHNFNDFFSFPIPEDSIEVYEKSEPIRNVRLEKYNSIFKAIDNGDYLNHFPYHSYDYTLKFFEEAAVDENVVSIKMTQYRVAKNSKIVESLIKAANNGKQVMVFVELKARFDEEQNIESSERMAKAGIKIYYSFPGLKVHAKIALVERVIKKKRTLYSYLGTGNFNEQTSKIYSDIGLMTSDKFITEECEQLFHYLAREPIEGKFKHLLVAQFNMRKAFYHLIENEIENAKAGNKAKIILKLNSLEDKKMITKLYEASCAGVKIDIVVRGICCLVPGVKNLSENIRVISIIDRYLEHARLFIFHNNGKEKVFAGSADWMKRNLSRRIEVAFPINDEKLKKEINDILKIQLNDNTHARIIDAENLNKYNRKQKAKKVRSQFEIPKYLKKLKS